MKLRKHKSNKNFKIRWSQRTPVVIETHVVRGSGATQKVVTGGELQPREAIIATGSNPTSVRNAFLFGRDRTNIIVHTVKEVR